MERAIMFSLTVICEDSELVLKAAEAVARAQIGLALEDMHTTLTIAPVNYETVEQEQE